MALILKQSTAVDVLIGPFLDLTDGATAEEGESPTVLLSKNGQALAAKSDITTPVHDDAGYYNCELDATDTNTVGTLVLIVEKSATALPVRHEFQVVEEAVYDDLYGASAVGYPTAAEVVDEWESQSQADPTGFHVNVKEVNGTAQTANDVGADVDAILVDTEDIQTRLPAALVGGRIDATIDATGMEAGAIDAILTRQMTESYAADGAAPTLAQALFEIMQCLTEFAISGTTITVKKRDGTTTAMTFTLDSATAPTSRTRAT